MHHPTSALQVVDGHQAMVVRCHQKIGVPLVVNHR